MIDPPAFKWLQILHGRAEGRWIEIRWAPKGQKMRREYRRPEEWMLRQVSEDVIRLAGYGDVFVGVAPRVEDRRGKRGGGLDNVSEAWALWADCDTPESVDLLATFKPEPSIVVGSGTGAHCHAYWSLSKAVPAAWVREGNARLAQALRADARCAEPARILRPPGTRNWKHDPATDVAVLWETGVEHSFSFVSDLPVVEQAKSTPAPVNHDRDRSELATIPAVEYVPALTGREVNAQGYVQCPFHSNGRERTPSLMVYPEADKGWHCFGCGSGGDVFTFGARLWNLSTRADFREIKQRLSEAL